MWGAWECKNLGSDSGFAAKVILSMLLLTPSLGFLIFVNKHSKTTSLLEKIKQIHRMPILRTEFGIWWVACDYYYIVIIMYSWLDYWLSDIYKLLNCHPHIKRFFFYEILSCAFSLFQTVRSIIWCSSMFVYLNEDVESIIFTFSPREQQPLSARTRASHPQALCRCWVSFVHRGIKKHICSPSCVDRLTDFW